MADELWLAPQTIGADSVRIFGSLGGKREKLHISDTLTHIVVKNYVVPINGTDIFSLWKNKKKKGISTLLLRNHVFN